MPSLSTSPDAPTLPDVVERVVEYIHLTGQHREEAKRPPLHSCPEDPCATWRRYLASRPR